MKDFEIVSYLAISFCVSLIFLLNSNHLNEQGIYHNYYLPLANNILEFSSYEYDENKLATYPMWGYPALLAIFKYFNILNYIYVFQYILALTSIPFLLGLVRNASRVIKVVSIVIFLFYAMAISVKWPDAILVYLVFMSAIFHVNAKYLVAGLLLGLAYNFRSEALFFHLVYVVFVIFNFKKFRSYSVIFSFVAVLPWTIYQYHSLGHFIPTSTNSGGVLYISLGQLPENVWDRNHLDSDAQDFIVESTDLSTNDPWGYESGKLLTEQFFTDVKNHPLEFARKLAYNGFSVLSGGLYTIETRYFFIQSDEAKLLISQYRSNKKLLLQDIISMKRDLIAIFVDVALKLLSILLFLVLILHTLYLLVSGAASKVSIFGILISLQVLITVFIQYQPRHISHVVVLFIFILVGAERSQSSDISK